MDARALFPPQTVAEVRPEVLEIVRRPPQTFGLARSRWWLEGVRQVLTWLQPCALSTIHALFKRLGIVYKRGRDYVHSPDVFYDLKLAYIRSAQGRVQRDPDRFVLLYQDEMTYYRRPSLERAYEAQGRTAPLAATGHSSDRKRRICACLNPVTGQVVALQRSRIPAKALLDFYHQVEACYPHQERIFIVQDNWPVHFHPSVSLALQTSRITLLRLPTYAPWTNPIEKLWRKLRQDVLHLHRFEDDWFAVQAAVQAWLERYQTASPDLVRYVGLAPD